MLIELTDAFSETGIGGATGVVLAAKGPVYCAGHDFTEMLGRDLDDVRHLFQTCTRLMDTMQSIPQPVIARVHALATGAGCQLVATADLAVASNGASFCTPGGSGGLFCTTPMVAVGRAIGRKRALEMAMSGDAIDAITASEWGLVNRVVAPEQLESATSSLLHRVTRGSSASKAVGKQAFYRQIDLDQTGAYEYAIEVMATASQSPDAQEGIAAFVEKRSPVWRGSS
jgi:enoyl-CoA hydratase/carnithine racemase